MENFYRLLQNILKEKVAKNVIILLQELNGFLTLMNLLLKQEKYMVKNMIIVR